MEMERTAVDLSLDVLKIKSKDLLRIRYKGRGKESDGRWLLA